MDKIKTGMRLFVNYMHDTWRLKLVALVFLLMAYICNNAIFVGEPDNPSGFLGLIAIALFIVRFRKNENNEEEA